MLFSSFVYNSGVSWMPSYSGLAGQCLSAPNLYIFSPLAFLTLQRASIALAQILQPLRLRNFRFHLLDQRLQLLLALLTGVGVDALGVFGTVRPGGRIASLKEVVVDLGDTASSRLSCAPHDRLEVGERICCRRVLRHFIAQATVDLGGSFAEHVAGDVGVNVQGGGR